MVRISLKSSQLPGTKLNNTRNTTLCQNQPLVSDNSCVNLKAETRAPAMTGTSSDHRNGLDRTKLEHNSSQPSEGSAHSALSGINTINLIQSVTSCTGAHSGSGLTPCSSAQKL